MRYRGSLRGGCCELVSRAAFDGITASAECDKGSIITQITERNGKGYVSVSVADGLCAYGRLLWGGTIEQYVKVLERAMEEGR